MGSESSDGHCGSSTLHDLGSAMDNNKQQTPRNNDTILYLKLAVPQLQVF